MKRVWQCEFCSETDPEAAAIEEHERRCAFNPANKRCWTCRNVTQEGAPMSGFWHGCNAGVPRDEQDDVEDGNEECAKWEPVPNAEVTGRASAACEGPR